jgi:hypothetical protein
MIYLASVRFSASRRKVVLARVESKYKGTPFYDMRVKAYSSPALALWSFITFAFIITVIFNAQ